MLTVQLVFSLLTFLADSIQTADASICVLSLPDLIHSTDESYDIQMPDDIAASITPETFVLLNKLDLLPSPLPLEDITKQLGTRRVSAVSLNAGTNTSSFVKSFSTGLRERCIHLFFIVRPLLILLCIAMDYRTPCRNALL
jgi:hypothetical protein